VKEEKRVEKEQGQVMVLSKVGSCAGLWQRGGVSGFREKQKAGQREHSKRNRLWGGKDGVEVGEICFANEGDICHI
jgi:hypothetical protein